MPTRPPGAKLAIVERRLRPSPIAVGAIVLAAAVAGCGGETAETASTTATTAPTVEEPSSGTPQPVPTTSSAAATVADTLPPETTSTTIPAPEWETIGTSVMGRPILATTLGDGTIRLYVLGGIHGDERAGADTAPMLLDHFLTTLPSAFTVRFVLDANPDGTVAATRENRSGIDLNRNWPTEDFIAGPIHGEEPLSEPESIALAADFEAFGPDVILALHSTWFGPFVNYDGPALGLAAAFAAAAVEKDDRWHVIAELDWGTPGSIGTYFGVDRGIPVITPEPSRYDSAAEIWPAMRAGIDAMLSYLMWQESVLTGVR